MNGVKKYLYLGIGLFTATLAVSLYVSVKEKKAIERKWEDAAMNAKSYGSLFSNSINRNAAFRLTIKQLENSNDSIFKELEATRKELKVKDSKLRSLVYASSSFSKSDTIVLKDTLFRDPCIKADTILSDKWYSIKVGLHYPSTITVMPEFRSVKDIVVSARRETVNPPKKFFLFRWFQKKHTVLNIDVIERNPHVKDENCRYVEIIK